MVSQLNLPDDFSQEIVFSAKQASAILETANVLAVPHARDLVQYAFDFSDAKFHNADVSTEGEKTVSEDSPTEIKIEMSTLYKILEFKDWEAADANIMIQKIAEQLPSVIASTLDKNAVAGTALVPTSRFAGYTEDAVTVDDSAAAWIAVFDALEANGHTATAAILDNRFKAAIRKAATEGTNINPLNTDVTDGYLLNGARVYFRNLGGNHGVVGDFSKAVVAINGEVETDYFSHKDSYELAKLDHDALKASVRIGYGVQDQTAFIPVVLGEVAEG